MKKNLLLLVGLAFMCSAYAQEVQDALRYSLSEIQGTARYRALSGAFGALGGDMSAVSSNPAGSAVFVSSQASFSLSSLNITNDTKFFNGVNSNSNSEFDIHQAGAAFVFANNNSNSPWRKFTLGIAYDKLNNFNTNWFANGVNTNSVDNYFLNYAQGLRLDEISAFPGESIADAYADIGSVFGYGHQQAFLGYESYILEPETGDDANSVYFSNIAPGDFNQEYNYAATGYNGKFTFNFATQYEDNLYLGLNLNSHFVNYERSTYFFEGNSNEASLIQEVGFENNLYTVGSGFSFQLGGILKLTPELRMGLSYDSPTWLSLEEETTQYIATVRNEGGSAITQVINPNVVNLFPKYRLQTPGKITGSFAYIFKDKGLISFDYSHKDFSNIKFKPTSDMYFTSLNNQMGNTLKSASTYRVGGEYRYKQFSFRGGYRFEESPYKDKTTIGDLTGYSLGLGYNFGNTKLDLTYDSFNRETQYQFFNTGLTDSVSIDSKNSNITLSLNFNL